VNILIITPYLADANNGNWRTAHRWQQLLRSQHRVTIDDHLPEATYTKSKADKPDVIIALHARRSHAAIKVAQQHLPTIPLIVVLTGTDLYRDLAESAVARESLDIANALIVLQEDAIQHVPHLHRHKTHIVFQSAPTLTPASKPQGCINAVVVGHLRSEKSPATVFAAAALLQKKHADRRIHIRHIGNALDTDLARQATELTANTRAAIKRAHVLVHPSIMEGGANVIVEAITAGTPVIASRMSGNVGMLGADYAGYFPVNGVTELVAQLCKLHDESNYLLRLNNACQARATLFTAAEETKRLHTIVTRLNERSA
jgi:putative glycosyltransferase (TIGR04348 family)